MIPKKLQAQVHELAWQYADFEIGNSKEAIERADNFHAGAQAMAKLILESEELKDVLLAAKAGGKLFDIMLEQKMIERNEPGILLTKNEFDDALTNWQAFIGEEE